MIALIFSFLLWREGAPELHLSLANVREAKGSIYIAVYANEADFLNPDKIIAKKIVPVTSAGAIDVTFQGLKAGAYAVSCFHDLNDNGQLDTNMFGAPLEPYGFSNNARPPFRAPNWEEARFLLKKNMAEKQAIWLQ